MNNYEYEIVENGLVEYKPKRKSNGNFKKAVLSMLSLGMVFGAGYAGASVAIRNIEPVVIEHEILNEITEPSIIPIAYTPSSNSLTDLFYFANPGVVAISTESIGRNFFGQTVMSPSSGSGFIISEEGYIVTNYHVIERANSVSVIMYDGEVYPAAVVGAAPEYDLAVLQIMTDRNLRILDFAENMPLVGEQVAAIGNPLGEFANSMSVGHVSALNRSITIDGVTFEAIQTDAAVNRGNSGGPLVNIDGEVIGVVTAKSGGQGVEGLGFAIPAEIASEIIQNILEHGSQIPQRAVLGVIVNPYSLTVEQVSPYSAADRAEITAGDRILAVDGVPVFNHTSLRELLDTLAPGDVIEVTVLRENQILIKKVTLGMEIA